jgi:Flagellar biosynthesis protein, FliO
MIEKQPKSYPPFQPSRERLAILFAELSEFDPEPKLKLEPRPEPRPESRPEPRLEAKLKLEPLPARQPEKQIEAAAVRKPAKKAKPKSKPVSAKKVNKKLSAAIVPARKSKKAPKPQHDMSAFHAVLRDCMNERVEQNPKQRREEAPVSPWAALMQRGTLGGLARIWSWLQSKYTHSPTKRLRLSEMVSLGEKRFVALVRVEDREFLVGGAASGLSLLAQVGAESQSADVGKRALGAEGRSR